MRAGTVLSVLSTALLLASTAAAQEPPADELRPIEQQVSSLRAGVGRTDARLRNLLGDDTFGAVQIAISQENHMSSLFRLERAQYSLDGQVVFFQHDDAGSLAGRARFDVYGGALPTGAHVLSLSMTYRLEGWGIFEYLHGYEVTMRSSTTLTVPSSGVLRVRAVLFESGSLAGALEDRPSVTYRVETSGRGSH